MASQRKGIATVKMMDGWAAALRLPAGDNNYAWHVNGWLPGTGRMPMLKSNDPETVAAFKAAVDQSYDGFALIFNEPTREENPETNIKPKKAAAFFDDICGEQEYPLVRWIVGNNRGKHIYSEGGSWIKKFMRFVSPESLLHVAGWGMHWYQQGIPLDSGVNALLDIVGLPVWVTEFGSDDLSEAEFWMNQAHSNPNVDRFFWYNDKLSQGADLTLITKRGELTALGGLYKEI